MQDTPLIKINKLSRYYDTHCAVDNISFELAAGDILGFLGPNGAGKSTTMQILSGSLAPSEGEVYINGIDLLDEPRLAKSFLGYLPEQPPVYKDMTVDEFLIYCAKLHRISKNAIQQSVDLAKERCSLEQVGKRLIGNLSKGFQQRVGIAQAIIHTPEVIILDEPTVGLDPIQIREIRELIVELGKEHGIILSTHILPEVQYVCNRVQIINQGELVFASSMADLHSNSSVGCFEISLKNPPDLATLSNLEFVENVEQINSNDLLLFTKDIDGDVVAKTAVENDWGLTRLLQKDKTLEQIFVDLTLGDTKSVSGNETMGEAA